MKNRMKSRARILLPAMAGVTVTLAAVTTGAFSILPMGVGAHVAPGTSDPQYPFLWDGRQVRPTAWADPAALGFSVEEVPYPSGTVLAGFFRDAHVDLGLRMTPEERDSLSWIPGPLWREEPPRPAGGYVDCGQARCQLRIAPEGEGVYLDLHHPAVLALLDGVGGSPGGCP